MMSQCYDAASQCFRQCWSLMSYGTTRLKWVDSLGPSDAIWRQRYGSTLAQVRACQAITWTTVDLSSVRSSDMHLRAVSHLIPLPPFTKIKLKIAYIIFHSNLPVANELIKHIQITFGKLNSWQIWGFNYILSKKTTPHSGEYEQI